MSLTSKSTIEHTRQDTLRTLSKSFHAREGVIKINKGNTFEHELSKFIVCWELAQEGKQFITEAIFETGDRADILSLDSFEAIEIVKSEQEKSIATKRKGYPVFVVAVKADDVLLKIQKYIKV